jgi:hypothetical protein
MMMVARYVKLFVTPYLRRPDEPRVAKVCCMAVENTTFEKHFRVAELAELWGLGRETVRKLVKDDPGVIKIRMGRKKSHTVYSVPESVAARIHTRLLNAG